MIEHLPAEAWAFLSVLVTQFVIVVIQLINVRSHRTTQKKVDLVERHVNNVEVDIDHDSDDVTLGQRLKRMEHEMRLSFDESRRIQELLTQGHVRTAEEMFKQAVHLHDEVGGYIVHVAERRPSGWRVPWASEGFTQITGLDVDDIDQGEYVDRIHPDDAGRVLRAFGQSLANETGWRATYRQLGPGGWQVLDEREDPYFDVNGRMVGRFGLVRVSSTVLEHAGGTGPDTKNPRTRSTGGGGRGRGTTG